MCLLHSQNLSVHRTLKKRASSNLTQEVSGLAKQIYKTFRILTDHLHLHDRLKTKPHFKFLIFQVIVDHVFYILPSFCDLLLKEIILI